ncbi:MAG: mucoidy inhibitor MuiA family protein [bacterium]|jgi:uncharacterized protein (TIGR02231 family)
MTILIALWFGMTVSSRIDTVIVYPNQVIVQRSARVNITGTTELVFSGLPGGLVDNSVRVRAPGLKIGDVQVKRGYLAEPTPEVQRLERRVQTLEDSVKMLEDEGTVLKAKEEFLNSIKLGAPEIISRELQAGKVAPESWRGALGFVAEELSRVKARQLVLAREVEAVRKRLDGARQELNAARALVENRKELRLTVEGEPGTFGIAFSYAVPRSAEWQPCYELRADPGKKKVDVSYYARLSQRTGEDWEDVRVILSTVRPSAAITPPEPEPWTLYLDEESFRAKVLPAPGGVMAEMRNEAEAAAPPVAEEITPVETGVSLQYAIPGRVSLKSGEGARKLSLTQLSFPAEFEFYTLPRLEEKAFLTGTLVNGSQFVLLAGEGNTYVNDEFTGTIQLPGLAPQESVRLGFGVDERVKVRRQLVRTFKSRTGITGRTERVQFVYRTTVENFHSAPVRIKVIEQVPVSGQKEIKVTVRKIEPKPVAQDETMGTFTYELELKSGERFEIELDYFVEYPAGKRVRGLF